MSPNSPAVGKTPTNAFYAELFETGIFSDLTIHYSGGHVFKVHSTVLHPKSKWFAKHWDGRKEVYHEGLSSDVVDLLFKSEMVGSGKPEDKTDKSKTCTLRRYFHGLLRFCYTSEYPVFNGTGQSKQWMVCTNHAFMYMLGKRYEVDDILPQAAQEFAKSMQLLRPTDDQEAASLVELIYKLPGLDDSDTLRKEATKQAELIVKNLSIKIPDELINKEVRKQVEQLMPNAGPTLITRGIKPKTFDIAMASRNAEEHICIRCYDPLDPVGNTATRLCNSCRVVPFTEQRVGAPDKVCMGASMAFWQCSGCYKRWHAEGARARLLEMVECLHCLPPPELGRAQRSSARVSGFSGTSWHCSGCRTVWHARGTDKGTRAELEECICCAEKSN